MFAAFQDLNIEGLLPGDEDTTTASSWLIEVFIIFILSKFIPDLLLLVPPYIAIGKYRTVCAEV